MSRKKKAKEVCPICTVAYHGEAFKRTNHHIFLKRWYGPFGLKVFVCLNCHKEFHNVHFKTDEFTVKWLPSECVQNWVKFCKSKGKNAYAIYPELMKLQPIR